VRENLWLALKQLAPRRPSREARVLWVDAICINQDDISERNHQVAQMGGIYSMASTVRVWLGPGDADSSAAFRWLHDEDNENKRWCPLVRHSSVIAGNIEEKVRNVSSLFGREYWTRLWIVQEFLAAHTIVLHCGKDSIEWDSVGSFLDIMQRYRLHYEAKFNISDILYNKEFWQSVPWRFHIDRKARLSGRSSPLCARNTHSLVALCSQYRAAKCQDSRDRVFGLRSLARACCQEAMVVNYAVPLEDLYARLIAHFLVNHQHESSSYRSVVEGIQEYNTLLGITTDELGNSDFTRVLHEVWLAPEFSAELVGFEGYAEEICYISSDFHSSFEGLPFELDETGIKRTVYEGDLTIRDLGMIGIHLDLVIPIAQEYSLGHYINGGFSTTNIAEEQREKVGVAMAFAHDIQTVYLILFLSSSLYISAQSI
jgi:hypothetical protein